MNVPIKIAEFGGVVLQEYIKAAKEHNEIELKRNQIENSIDKHWSLISNLMKDYLMLSDYPNRSSMYEQAIDSRHLVKSLRDENPLMTIYKIEEYLKSLRELLLDERETAVRKEKLEEQIDSLHKFN